MSLNAKFLCMVLLKPLKELGFALGPGEREPQNKPGSVLWVRQVAVEEGPLQVDEGNRLVRTAPIVSVLRSNFLELEEREIAMSKPEEAAQGPQGHLALKGTAVRGAGSDCRRKGTDTGLG